MNTPKIKQRNNDKIFFSYTDENGDRIRKTLKTRKELKVANIRECCANNYP